MAPKRGWSRCALLRLMLACAPLLCACGAESRPPNVVFVISDDQAWTDFGFMGSAIVETPNLDRLAREGLVFSQARNTASVCRASLITLLTGLDPLQWESTLVESAIFDASPDLWRLPDRVPTLPGLLRQRGYQSFQGGKFWEGSFERAGFSHGMTEAPSGSHFFAPGGKGLALGRETMEPLLDFLDQVEEEPFFVWFAPSVPHYPHDPPPRWLERYAGRDFVPAARRYFAMCSWLDEMVGELLEALDERALLDDTLIVFLADNGWQQDPFVSRMRFPMGRKLAGSKGKLSMHELGFRTPIILRWPGRIPAGLRSEELISTLDLVPTILDYAGIAVPEGLLGRSLRPALDEPGRAGREYLIASMGSLRPDAEQQRRAREEGRDGDSLVSGRAFNLRSKEWSYIRYMQREVEELYDIGADPQEERNLALERPEVVGRLRAAVEAWRHALAAPFVERARQQPGLEPLRRATWIDCLERSLPMGECVDRLARAAQGVSPAPAAGVPVDATPGAKEPAG